MQKGKKRGKESRRKAKTKGKGWEKNMYKKKRGKGNGNKMQSEKIECQLNDFKIK